MGDARWDQVEYEFMIDPAAANDDGVAGVVAALIASDDVKMRREQIYDLTLAFVSPLRADDCEVHACGLSGHWARRLRRNRLIAVIRVVMLFDFQIALD